MNRESERQRLVELTDNFLQEELGACLNKDILEKFAQHLLDNGVIVPPYKYGDKVYVVDRGSEACWKGTVVAVDCSFGEFNYGIMHDDGDFSTYNEADLFTSMAAAQTILEAKLGGKEDA